MYLHWQLERGFQRTPSRSNLSSRWRGTIVTSCISHRKATSEGSKPDECGNAMTMSRLLRAIDQDRSGLYDTTATNMETGSLSELVTVKNSEQIGRYNELTVDSCGAKNGHCLRVSAEV